VLREQGWLLPVLPLKLHLLNPEVVHASPEWIVVGMLWFMSRVRSFREVLSTGLKECCALVDMLVATAPQAKPVISIAKLQAMKPL